MNYKRRRKRKNTIYKKIWKKSLYFAKNNLIYLLSFFFVCIIFVFSIIGYNIYVDTPENTIKESLFSKEYIKYLNLDWVLEYTKDKFSWQNILKLKYFTFDSIKEDLLSKYYFLEDVNFQKHGPSSIYIDFTLRKPLFVFSGVNNDYLVYNKEHFFTLEKENTLFLSGNSIINLATFVTWDVQGIFYKTNPEIINKFVSWIKELVDPDAKFTFIPWWEKLLVIADNGKKIYFDLQKNLDLQIENLFILKKQLEYYKKSYMIDVSSLSSGVYLHIKKKDKSG